jgi:L-threonylcarbamoyladenylate synthase
MTKIKTEVAPIDPQDPDSDLIRYAVKVLETGGLVVLPTDTVYGLVCDPRQAASVEAIYRAKGRRKDSPLALLLHDMSQVSDYAEEIPDGAARAMQAFWPGPLTVVLRSRSDATAAVRAGKDSIGLRLPAHMIPRLVAGGLGAALASTSANRSSEPAAVTADQALAHLEDKVHLLLDGGQAPLSSESTVISFLGRRPEALRLGAISLDRLQEVLGEVVAKTV